MSLLPRLGRRDRDGIDRLFVRGMVAFAGAQVVVVALIVAFRKMWARAHAREEAAREGYPWRSFEEVALDGGAERVRVFASGGELYDAMLEAIEGATTSVYMETFIWKGDATGTAFRDALARKAREGVDVRVIFDNFANLVVPAAFKTFPREVHTLRFHPAEHTLDHASPRQLLRDHRKLLVVDQRVGFVGGFNIGDAYAGERWRDTHLRITGDAVKELTNAFVDFWNAHRTADLPPLPEVERRTWRPTVQLHRNDPFLRIFPIRGMYLEAIDRAAQHIFITQAYFVPDRALRAAIVDAAKRGVDVQVLLPWVSNHALADWAARRHFEELLRAGVRLFAYRDMIHAKTATIDGVWSTVGTANLDRLSLLGNYETNLELYDPGVARQLEELFELDKTHAVELDLQRWQHRTFYRKAAERVLESLAPLV